MLVGVLGRSWDDAFVEDTPSSPRDAPVKVRAALSEGVKNRGKKNQFFSGNVMLNNMVVLGHRCLRHHPHKPSKKYYAKDFGVPNYRLNFSLSCRRVLCFRWLFSVDPTISDQYDQFSKFLRADLLYFQLFLFFFFFFLTISLHNALGGAWWSP